MTDILERLRKEASDATDWHGETMKQWDKIRALCAERDGSDLPRLMFEGLIESLADLMVEGAAEIERLREAMAMADNRLEVAVVCTEDGGRDVCEHCIGLARSYLTPPITSKGALK